MRRCIGRPPRRCQVSAFNRVASGSLASWSRIGVTLVAQLALVPIYLSYWSAETYGVWLALQAFYTFGTILGMAHLTFLENEFIRIGNSSLQVLGRVLWSAIPMAALIAVVQLALVAGLIWTGLFASLVTPDGLADHVLASDAAWVALAQLVGWLIVVTVSLYVRMLCGIGYYSRFAWWGLPYVILYAAVPVAVLACGGGFLAVGLSQVVATLVCNGAWLVDALRIATRHAIAVQKPDLDTGAQAVRSSGYVLLRLFLETLRQSGFRLAMLPTVGPVRLAEFSTQRTVGNTAFQCLNSVYAPLLPELMRYVRERRQEHIEGAFSMLWMLLVLILGPLTILLQALMPTLFPWWTRNAFAFDGVLLSLLSASVLMNIVSLPAVAVCSGNNLVAAQLRIAVIAAVVLFVTLIPLTRGFGIRGSAVSLLLCETAASALYVRTCAQWLRSVSLRWPAKAFRVCLSSVVQVFAMSLLIALRPNLLALWLTIYVASLVLMVARLWNATPRNAKVYLSDRLREFHFVAR
jgi:O-antigen/teichoic acid export membrane protein